MKKMDMVVDDRVIKTHSENEHPTFVLLKDNSPHINSAYQYHAIRTMKKSVDSSIKRHKARHPKCVKIFEVQYNPNSINLWIRVRDKLRGEGKICVTNSDCGLLGDYKEEDFINDINKINDERYDV